MIAPLSPIPKRNDADEPGRTRPGHDPVGAGRASATSARHRPGQDAGPGKRAAKVPAYRVHRGKDLGYVRLLGRMVYLGRANSPESLAAYHRTVAEFLASGRLPGAGRKQQGGTVAELVEAYLEYAGHYYLDAEGRPSSGIEPVKAAATLLKEVYGAVPAVEFGPIALRGLRHVMIDRNLCRNVVNQRVNCVKRVFKWAAADERVPPQVFQALACVEPLRRGRSGARETPPVRPVPDAHVDAVLPFLPRTVAAMVQLQRLTGMRSGEVCQLRPADLDRTGAVWVYSPPAHKTAYRGHRRLVRIGPRGQEVLRPFLAVTPEDRYVFSPRRAIRERAQGELGLYEPGATAVSLGEPKLSTTGTARRVGDHYVTRSYQRAVRYAILVAGGAGKLAAGSRWHPHRLRHAHATLVRRAHGLEAARVLLGHRTLEQSCEYAEADATLAETVVRQLG